MKWKAIGNSVQGSSHVGANQPCQDTIRYNIVKSLKGDEVLICCVSDGAGSAKCAQEASANAAGSMFNGLSIMALLDLRIKEEDILLLATDIFGSMEKLAEWNGVELNDYSCTLCGCFIAPEFAVFFQVGDGAIVRNDGTGFYTPVWWPHNGEYHNETSFITDDPNMGNLRIMILEEAVNEVAIFSDGLQLLALNMEEKNAHQPFFDGMFRHLRTADCEEKIATLNGRLEEYLNSKPINDRTDDDKTLFLGTRLCS
jgi:hypothetical protein